MGFKDEQGPFFGFFLAQLPPLVGVLGLKLNYQSYFGLTARPVPDEIDTYERVGILDGMLLHIGPDHNKKDFPSLYNGYYLMFRNIERNLDLDIWKAFTNTTADSIPYRFSEAADDVYLSFPDLRHLEKSIITLV